MTCWRKERTKEKLFRKQELIAKVDVMLSYK